MYQHILASCDIKAIINYVFLKPVTCTLYSGVKLDKIYYPTKSISYDHLLIDWLRLLKSG